jgi:PKD repeat protein
MSAVEHTASFNTGGRKIMKLKTLIVIGFFMCTVSVLPAAVSAADPDAYVVTTDYSGNSYYMAFNADGTFDDMVLVGTTSSPSRGNAIGDFDGDGDYDFVVAGGIGFGSIYLFEKLGPGNNFALPKEVGQWDLAPFTGDMAAADFDGDGQDDVVLTYIGSADCELYLNYDAVSGLFTRSTLTGAASVASIGVDAADVDDDGNIDFVVAPYEAAGQFAINYANLNNGDGTFTTETFAAGTFDPYYGIAVADFSGNDLVDLLASSYGYIDFYRGSDNGPLVYDPEGGFDSGAFYPTPMDNFDVNGDGMEDLLVGAVGDPTQDPTQVGKQVAVFLNQGDGSFVPGAVYGGALVPLSAISALPYNQPPAALADASVTQTYVGEPVQFDGTGSSDDDGEIVSYVWDFDDGHIAEGATPEHIFDAVGTYTVTLTVTDNRGAESSDEIQIEVQEVASLSATIRIFPRTLNLGSKGRWVTAWIKMPKGYSASEVDPGSIRMLVEGSSDPVFSVSNSKRGRFHKKRWLKVKFDRQDVVAAIAAPAGKFVLQVEGSLKPAGTQKQITGKQEQISFSGSDTIRTIEKKKKSKKTKTNKRSSRTKNKKR